MSIYHHRKRKIFSGPHLLGLLFTLAGTFSMISPYLIENTSPDRSLYIGIGGIGFGLLVLSIYSGTIIDFEKRKLREYTTVLGYKFGEWTNLPDIASVQLVAHSYEDANISNGISPTLSGEITDYVAILCNQEGEPLTSFTYAKEQKAIAEVKMIAAQLGVEPGFLVTN